MKQFSAATGLKKWENICWSLFINAFTLLTLYLSERIYIYNAKLESKLFGCHVRDDNDDDT
jgi:hypothetical protein